MRSLKIAVTEVGELESAPVLTGMMLELSVDQLVCITGLTCTIIIIINFLCLALPAVKNLTVVAVSHTTITVRWLVSSRY